MELIENSEMQILIFIVGGEMWDVHDVQKTRHLARGKAVPPQRNKQFNVR